MRYALAPVRRLLGGAKPRKRLFLARLFACLFLALFASILGGIFPDLIWLGNGAILACLLLEPRRHWLLFLVLGYSAEALCRFAACPDLLFAVLFTAFQIGSAALTAHLIRSGRTLPRFNNPSYLILFIAVAGVASPLWKALALALPGFFGLHLVPSALHLPSLPAVINDSLGICVSTPACVAILRLRVPDGKQLRAPLIFLLASSAVSLFAFVQDSLPPSVLLYPVLVLILLRLDLAWGTFAALLATGIGSWYTAHPFRSVAVSHPAGMLRPSISFQIFLGAALIILYSISEVLQRRRIAEHRLNRIARLHSLVTEYSRDIIIIADLQGVRRYVSSAGDTLSGWSRAELLQHNGLDMIHPEDHHLMVKNVEALGRGMLDATVECRVRNRDNCYRWMEISLRCILDPKTAQPAGVLSIARDISERKNTEKRLQEAYKTVEALAITDALTGLANRRRFDQCLVEEWRRGMRDRRPLSLLIIDVDRFKSYNDTYGHLRGDNALKQIAESVLDVVSRPGDLVARFGGEEFAVVLPATDAYGADQVAAGICNAARGRRLKHIANPDGILTISIGHATTIPQPGHHATELIDLADQALYRAKDSGRNRVCSLLPARTEPEVEIALPAMAAKSA